MMSLVTYGLSIGTDLNGHEWRNSPFLMFFTEFDSFARHLCRNG